MDPDNVELDHFCDHCDYLRLPDRLVFVLHPKESERERGKGIINGAFLLDENGGVSSMVIGVQVAGLYIGLDEHQANHLIMLLREAFPQGGDREAEWSQAQPPAVLQMPDTQPDEHGVHPSPPTKPLEEGWAPPGWTQPRLPNVDVVPPWHPDRERP